MVKRSKKEILLQLDRLLCLQVLTAKQSGRWLTTHLSFATEHLPDKGELIFKVFKSCVVHMFLLKRSPLFRKRIFSMLEFPQRSSWTIFLDKLTISEDPIMLTTLLLKILVQELISRERGFRPFWTPAYKVTSEKLLLPTEIDCAGSVSSLSNCWSASQEEKSRFLTIRRIKHVNKNSPTTCWPSSMSSHVAKWAKGVTPAAKLKTVKIKIYPTLKQKKILNEFFDTSRYVYNKALETIKKGHKPRFQSLRDLLVTENTKKGYPAYHIYKEEIVEMQERKKTSVSVEEKKRLDDSIKKKNQDLRDHMKKFKYVKNTGVKEFETFTAKDIRSNAIKRCCDAYKSGFTNLKKGNIKYFNLNFQKKSENRQCIELTPKNISMKHGVVKILPETFKDCSILKISKLNKKKYNNLEINNNVDIVREKGVFTMFVSMSIEAVENSDFHRVAGVDLGIRTFATVHTHSANEENTITEYSQRCDVLNKLNIKLKKMKKRRQQCRKKQYNKIEYKKIHLVDKLHWDFINDLLKHNDVVYLGDIKSHDIVKDGKNSRLNQDMNDLKFYLLKQRLIYKASLLGKSIFLVPEHYTTKTCSSCGKINDHVGCKKVFHCTCCGINVGRDANASKNMKMKGMLS